MIQEVTSAQCGRDLAPYTYRRVILATLVAAGMKRPVSEVYCPSPYLAVPHLQAVQAVQAVVPPPQATPVPFTPAFSPAFTHSLTPVSVTPALTPLSVTPAVTHFTPMMHFIDQVGRPCPAPVAPPSSLLPSQHSLLSTY